MYSLWINNKLNFQIGSWLSIIFPSYNTFFFWIRGNLTLRKAHFVGPSEGVKFRLSQALIRGARPDSNSRPTVQISNPLPSYYASWGPSYNTLTIICHFFVRKKFVSKIQKIALHVMIIVDQLLSQNNIL